MQERDSSREEVTLGAGAVTTSRLGFGCSGLMRVASQRDRQRLLAAAFDSGIRHFDVARLYGLGAAEAELGRFARGRRDQITIATKFGIEPAVSVARLARLQRPARAMLGRFPAVRRAIRRREETLIAPRRYDASAAVRSLDRSLAEVGTDYFDILFVHDPSARDQVMVDDLVDFFHRARDEGKIRSWGVASEGMIGAELAAKLGSEAILQLRYDLLASDTLKGANGRPQIVFGVLGSALPQLSTFLNKDRRLRQEWADRLGLHSVTEGLAELLLMEAVDSNRGAIVLMSSTRPSRIDRAAAAVRSETDEARLTSLRELAAQASRQRAI